MTPVPEVVIAGRYRLEKPLAKGGMGALWVAHHQQLDTQVAIKFITSLEDDPAVRVRFEREAKAAARLRSPHVVQVLDYGVEENTPYIVMELLEGESLDAMLRRRTTLPLGETLAIVAQIVKALELAHAARIVHRDLKPANVFASHVGKDVIFKILDFGIAADTTLDISSRVTEAGILLGSPYHVSPEQARGATVDARSDLWSLGVVVFQMLTGQRPFTGTNFGDIVTAIFCDPVPRASALAPGLPPALDAFFDRAFARNPDFRFQTATELLDAFAALVPDAPAQLGARGSEPPPEVVVSRDDADEVRPRGDATRRVAGVAAPDPSDDTTRVSQPPPSAPPRAPVDDMRLVTNDSLVIPVALSDRGRRRLGARAWWLVASVLAIVVIAGVVTFASRGAGAPDEAAPASPPEHDDATVAAPRLPAPVEAEPAEAAPVEAAPVEPEASSSAAAPSEVAPRDPGPRARRPRTPRETPSARPKSPPGSTNPFF